MTNRASIAMSRASATDSATAPGAALKNVSVLLVAPSLGIMGGQAVQADLLYRNFRAEGVRVGFLPINPVPWGPLKYLTRVKYLRTLVVSVFYLCSLLLTVRKYDVIHIFSASYFSFILAPTPALLISRLYGKKTILNYRSGEAEDHFNRSGKFVFRMLRLADRMIVPSRYLVDVFARFGFKATPIYNISDFSQFRFRERREVQARIIVARNLEPLYDVATALRAFGIVKAELPDAVITIVGDGSARRSLKRMVAEENLADVHFTGRVERSEIPRLFDDADLFLNTSIIDNMPVAIIEAFYAGLPVVTTNAGGIPYFVKHEENGLVCEMGDTESLAQAVLLLLRDDKLRAKLIEGGRRTAAECSWEAVKSQWTEAYRSLVAGNG